MTSSSVRIVRLQNVASAWIQRSVAGSSRVQILDGVRAGFTALPHSVHHFPVLSIPHGVLSQQNMLMDQFLTRPPRERMIRQYNSTCRRNVIEGEGSVIHGVIETPTFPFACNSFVVVK